MLLHHQLHGRPARRGVILMVVLALLTLFAIVGISFVLYADAEARGSQLNREAEVNSSYTVDPTSLLQYGLGQLIFDADSGGATGKAGAGIYSAMRGLSLARNMYGYNDDPNAAAVYGHNNAVAYNGVGRIHNTSPLTNYDDYNVVNYTYYPQADYISNGSTGGKAVYFIYDPERLGPRQSPPQPTPVPGGFDPGSFPSETTNPFYGFNVPYTYPDWNNLYLAQQGPDGTPYEPSFHRSWSAFGSLDPSNPNWYTPFTPGSGNSWAHAMLRPRPIDQLLQGETWPPARPYFPPPEDAGGDVKNRTGAPGGNDSFWMDLDYPVLTAPDGTLYKPLFAFYVLDLDGRVNVNIHGNIANGGNHSSNLGWGPWTVNPAQVFSAAPLLPPFDQTSTLLTGNGTYIGRYGHDMNPSVSGTSLLSPMGTTPLSPGLTNVPFYSQVDFKGLAAAPLVATGTANSSFPTWPAGYDQANNPNNDFLNHPGLYNPYLPSYNPVTQQQNADDHPFASANMEYMARGPFDSGAASLSAEVLALLPKSMSDQTVPNLATGLSFDVDRPGISPYFNFVATDYTLQNMVVPSAPPAPPSGSPPITYPVANGINPSTTNSLPIGPLNQPSDFQQTDWRSLAAVLGRIDLNRSLPNYPPPGDWSAGAAATQFQAATIARQDFARDIFTRLVAVTMGMQPDYIDIDPSTGKPGYWAQLGPNNTKLANNYPDPVNSPTQYNALIWLAQLAVNIVDYIDNDDVMTVFFWNPTAGSTDRVIGTELPRLLLNEVYLEWQNPAKKVGAKGTSTKATVNAWVELFNPLNKDTVSTLSLQGGAMLYNAANNTSCYQLQIAKQFANVSTPGQQIRYWIQNPQSPNVEGNVGAGQTYATTAGIQFAASPIAVVPPSNGAANGGGNSGYFVVGNSANFKGPPGGGPAAPVDFQTALSYTENVYSDGLKWLAPPAPTVVLQRLACPYLPNNGSAANPATYNPYVTVDYLEYACYNGQGPNPVYPANKEGQYLVWQNNSFGPPLNNPAMTRQSDGRKDPYRSLYSPPAPAQIGNRAAQAAVANQPAHTLGAQNSSLHNPLFWLPQMDRALVSPMELLQVSSVPPSLLTQEFGNPYGNAAPGPNAPLGLYDHRAPWFDEDNPTNSGPPVTPQSHLLYRLFEFVSTRSQFSANTSISPLGGGLVGPPSTLASAAIAVGLQTVTPTQMWVSGSSGVPLQIRQGDVVIIDYGLPTQENVRVLAATTNSFSANFLVPHGNNAPITPTILGDRLPGKINLNSVWDRRVFNALVDPQASNYFNNPPSGPALNLGVTFANFLHTRSPNTMSAKPTPSVAQNDQPLMGMGSGLYQVSAAAPTMPYPGTYQQTNGISVGNTTFFMRDRTNPNFPLFSYPEDHTTPPLNRFELISKMGNNITPRSNVFAVWMTVGFFQVLPDPNTGKLTPKPYILGAEIGKAENKNVRRRLFAIVDRSSLMANVTSVPTFTTGAPPIGTWPRGFPVAVTTLSAPSAANTNAGIVTAISGNSTLPLASPPSGAITWGFSWNLSNQQILVIDAGTPQEEFVTIQNVPGVNWPNFQIAGKFQFNHAAGATVTLGAQSGVGIPFYQTMIPGNPGPKPFFDAQVNPGIVRYTSIIQ